MHNLLCLETEFQEQKSSRRFMFRKRRRASTEIKDITVCYIYGAKVEKKR